jgi:hypothetical protein
MKAVVRGLLLLPLSYGCSGQSCMTPMERAFPPEARIANAIQVRVTSRGLATIAANVGHTSRAVLGEDQLLEVPELCGGNADVCCGAPPGTCNLRIDFDPQNGDLPRMELDPNRGTAGDMGFVMRMRVNTHPQPLPVYVRSFFGNGPCQVAMDSRAGKQESLTIRGVVRFEQEPVTGTTQLRLGDFLLEDLERDDVEVIGRADICETANDFRGIVTNVIADVMAGQASSLIDAFICKRCETAIECGANAYCASSGYCFPGTAPPAGNNDDDDDDDDDDDNANAPRCLQELGVTGAMSAGSVLPGVPSAAKMDVYMVAGGEARTVNSGLSLNLLGGVLPAQGTEQLACGQATEPPAMESVPIMSARDVEELPDLGAFDMGIGIHRSYLNHHMWSSYQSGVLCGVIDTQSVDLLTSDSLTLLLPSSLELVHKEVAQAGVRLRPQVPPTITLDGEIGSLMVLHMPELEMDFFLNVDERLLRLFTAKTEMHLPLNLEVDADGQLMPVVADRNLDGAFGKATVVTTGMLEESAERIAGRFSALGAGIVPAMVGAIGPIPLPDVLGMTMEVPPNGVRKIDNEFVGIFGDLKPVSLNAVAAVETTARVGTVSLPPLDAYQGDRFERGQRPVVELELGGTNVAGRSDNLEWQVRVDGGVWSPFSRDTRRVVARDQFWLGPRHTIEVRAREVGQPVTTDRTPAVVTVQTAPHAPANEAAQGALTPAEDIAASAGGCSVVHSARPGLGTWGLLVAAVWAVRRRRRRGLRAGVPTALLALMLAGMGCGKLFNSGGDDDRPTVPTFGRWSDVADDGTRTVVSAYEETFGDLAFGEIAADGTVSFTAIAGLPASAAQPDMPPDAEGARPYRGGSTQPGDNVGAWNSVILHGGRAYIAYQDTTAGTLRLALEGASGWESHEVDAVDGATLGRYASLSVSASGRLGIAYQASAVPDGQGKQLSQLRWAEAAIPATGAPSWTVEVVAHRAVEPIEKDYSDIPQGTGLYASGSWLPDGAPVVSFYDRSAGAVMFANRRDGTWQSVMIDGPLPTEGEQPAPVTDVVIDIGRWSTLAVAGDGTVHLAYQDARQGQLRYTTVRDLVPTPFELVDDGERDDLRHDVGASATIIVDQNDQPRVFYQDSFTVELLSASRNADGSWSHTTVLDGPMGHGFSISAARSGSGLIVTSYAYDRAVYPPGVVQTARVQ